MDTSTYFFTIGLMICIGLFGVIAVGGSIYGILIWYPRYRQKKVDALKVTGRQGEATILEVQEGERPSHVRRAVVILTPIRLEIRVPGIETYEVNKNFTIPSHLIDRLKKGAIVPVWVDPKNPRDLDQIVIDL